MATERNFIVVDEEGNPDGITDPIQDVPPDPKPTTKTVKRPTTPKIDPPPAKRGRPSKTDVEREIAEEFQSYIKLIAMTWSVADSECAPVLDKQSKAIADSLAALLAKNPRLLEKFRNMTGLGEWTTLFFALLPVIKAINSHHIAPGLKKKKDETDGYNPEVQTY